MVRPAWCYSTMCGRSFACLYAGGQIPVAESARRWGLMAKIEEIHGKDLVSWSMVYFPPPPSKRVADRIGFEDRPPRTGEPYGSPTRPAIESSPDYLGG